MHIGREIKLFPNGSCTLEERFDYDSMGYAHWKRGSVVSLWFMHIGREVKLCLDGSCTLEEKLGCVLMANAHWETR